MSDEVLRPRRIRFGGESFLPSHGYDSVTARKKGATESLKRLAELLVQ